MLDSLHWKPLLGMTAAYGSALYCLWLTSLPREFRPHRLWAPVCALLFAATCHYLFREFHDVIAQLTEKTLVFVRTHTGWELRESASGFPIYLNLFVLWLFVCFKALVLFVGYIYSLLVRCASWLKRRLWGRGAGGGEAEETPGDFSFAYEYDPKRGLLLRKGWVTPGYFARNMAWALGAVILLSIAFTVCRPVKVSWPVFPVLPAAALVFFLEAAWHLSGKRPFPERMKTPDEASPPETVIDYGPLWEEYQRIWPERFLAAWHMEGLEAPRLKGVERSELTGDAEDREAARVWNGLLRQGFEAPDAHYDLLKDLWRGGDVLVSDVAYDQAAPVLLKALQDVLVRGRKILILLEPDSRGDTAQNQEIARWLKSRLPGSSRRNEHWRVADFEAYRSGALKPDALLASARDLLFYECLCDDWFKDLGAIFIPNGSTTVFKDILSIGVLLNSLKDRNAAGFNCIIVSADCLSLEAALRNNLPINPNDHRLPPDLPLRCYAILWRLEGESSMQRQVMQGKIPEYCGVEAVLALPAWRDGVECIQLLGQDRTPWKDCAEAVEKRRNTLRPQVIDPSKLSGSARDVLKRLAVSWLPATGKNAFLLVRDRKRNLVAALLEGMTAVRESGFVHVVSPPYLLRDYLAENVEFFIRSPLLPLAERTMRSPLTAACPLLERLTHTPLTEDAVLSQLPLSKERETHAYDGLVDLFKTAFDLDLGSTDYLRQKLVNRFNEKENEFEEVTLFSLAPEIKKEESLRWLTMFDVQDDAGRILGRMRLDHIHQNFLPQQVRFFEGKPYSIDEIDHLARRVLVSSCSASGEVSYRPSLEVALRQVHPVYNRDIHRISRRTGRCNVRLELRTASYEVVTDRFFTFETGIDLPSEASSTQLDRPNVRDYPCGRMLSIAMKAESRPAEEVQKVAFTLSLLLKEAFYTLFPETHQYVLVCPAPPADADADANANACIGANAGANANESARPFPFLPVMHATPEQLEALLGKESEGAVNIFIIEDSHLDMGVAQCVFEEWEDIVQVLDDYIAWTGEERTEAPSTIRLNLQPKPGFLAYGQESLPTELDLEGVRKLLHAVLQGRNELTTQRRNFVLERRSR